MKVAIIMNAGAGAGANGEDRTEVIRAAFAEAGVDIELHLTPPADLVATAERLATTGVDAVIAAGGDGTVSAVASALAGSQMTLGVLPLGTLNHFAHDIGMPDDLAAAAHLIATGKVQKVDVGEVNGRVFINNSSVGLYPETVMSRDEEQRRSGRSKWSAMALASARVLKRFPLLAVSVALPERNLIAKTPLIFVGNNEYTISMLQLGKRTRLDAGHLSVYMMRCKGRLGMFSLMMRAILQRLEAIQDFEAETAEEVVVRLHHRRLNVAVDGEVVRMASPLRYKIRPGALSVIVP
jgi:diacylglycerol kinase family enzyme